MGPKLSVVFKRARFKALRQRQLAVVLWNSLLPLRVKWPSFFKIYFNWRLIILQYCGGFCHIVTGISHGYICAPHPELPSHLLPPHLLPHPIPQHHPSAPALSALSHASNLDWQCFTYDKIHVSMLFSQIISPVPSPTESKRLFYTSVPLHVL